MTTMRKIKTGEAHKPIAAREEFQTHGQLTGLTVDVEGLYRLDAVGLTGHDLEAFDRDCEEIRYVVKSYATPIAWYTELGYWHFVAQKFSPTTAKHQAQLWLAKSQQKPRRVCRKITIFVTVEEDTSNLAGHKMIHKHGCSDVRDGDRIAVLTPTRADLLKALDGYASAETDNELDAYMAPCARKMGWK